jgi:hypothetical protein
MVRFNLRLAIAECFSMDYSTIEGDYRYQPTRTPCAVFSIGDDYYTATKSPTIKPKQSTQYRWEQFPGTVPNGWQVWKRKL